MKYIELLSTEKDYYAKLTEDERKIYLASQEQLAAINTWNDHNVHSFVDVARLMNELHRLHQRYNDLMDEIYKMPNATEDQQKHFNSLNDINEELFSMSLTIGNFSAVLPLSNMDECDALYVYLAAVKKSQFDLLCENFDIAVLIETLESHGCY